MNAGKTRIDERSAMNYDNIKMMTKDAGKNGRNTECHG